VAATVPNGTVVTLSLHVGGQFTCDRAGTDLTLTFTVGTMTVARAGLAAVSASVEEGAILTAPAVSLRNFDGGVCILQDTP